MPKKLLSVVLLLTLLSLTPSTAHAQDEIVCSLDIIVQIDDWLSKLSEKFYGDIFAYPAIFEATNAKAAVDPSYAVIEEEDLIEPGWKLCIVDVEVAEEILEFELESAPIADSTPINLTGVINIGAAYDLSGPFAGQGQSIRNGIDLAVKEINETGFLGEAALQIIWEDTAGDPAQAVQAFNKFIEQEQIIGILGPTLSRSAFAAIPVAQAAQTPVIGSSITASGVTDIGDFVFRTNLPESAIIANTLQTLKDPLNLQSVAIIYDSSNAFTKLSRNEFDQALNDAEIDIVTAVDFSGGDTDFSAQLQEIQGLQPNAIILVALAEEAANIILQARQLGISEDVRFIGGNSFNSPSFFALGGSAVDGVLSGTAWNRNIPTGTNRQFVADYEAEYSSPPDQLAAQSYAAVRAFAAALRNADSTDKTAIREALDSIEFIESPLGLLTFDENRNADHLPVVQVADQGTFIIFQ